MGGSLYNRIPLGRRASVFNLGLVKTATVLTMMLGIALIIFVMTK